MKLASWSGRRDSNPRQPAWKAGTLPTELLPQNRIYFSPKTQLCQTGSPCLTKNAATELGVLIEGYTLCSRAEGKSPKTISTVTSSVSYLERYLSSEGWPTDAKYIGPNEIRAFILYLKSKKRFSQHPYATPQQDGLSDHSINCYVRSVRAFWSWLAGEGIIDENPFARVKVPRAPRKVIPTFSPSLTNLACVKTSLNPANTDRGG